MFEVFANDYRITIQEIPLGNQGEDMARCLVIDITDAVLEFGSGGTISVRNKRNGDEMPYFATNVSTVTGADAEGNVHTYIKWTLTDVDTAVAGSGFVQADYVISGVTVKSWVYKYFILPSLGVTGDVPDPYEDILEEIEAQVAAVQAAAASAAQSASRASAEATRIITTTESVVEDWLSDHIVTGYTVDDTLTISGAAADSKKAGDMIRAAFVTEQASGPTVSFADGADGVPLKDLAVNIAAGQSGSGDPSPSNIRPITGYYSDRVYVTGKNLINVSNTASTTINGVTFTVDSEQGTITANGTASDTANLYFSGYASYDGMLKLQEFEGKQVTLSGCPSGGSSSTYALTAARINTEGTLVNEYGGGRTFTVGDIAHQSGTMYLRITVCTGTVCDNLVFKPMLRLADTDDTFEPYKGKNYYISFGDAGTVYGGTLDVTTGILTVTNKVRTLSTSNWTYDSTYTRFSTFFSDMVYGKYGARRVPFMCSTFLTVDDGRSLANVPNNAIYSAGTSTAVYIKCTEYTTEADFKAAYGDAQIVYEIANPISYQLSPTEVKTILGQNNIWLLSNSITNLEYRADTRLYIEHLTSPDGDMVADANIASGQYFMVKNNLYLATSAIAAGATIIPGTNCTATNLAAALNAINS